jgi:hypothetical protein
MNIKDTQLVIEAAALANDTVIIEGVHGVGKSAIVKQFAKDNNYNSVELFLSMMDTGDMLGMPRTRQVGATTITTWAEPDWFQTIVDKAWPQEVHLQDITFNDAALESFITSNLKPENNKYSREALNKLYCEHYDLIHDKLYLTNGQLNMICNVAQKSVLFLDELNRANIDVRQATLQLILEKELHCHVLPFVQGQQTLIVAAINPADQYQVDELDPALLDRFLHVTVEADAKAWLSWGRATKVNPVVLDFITEHADRLHWQPQDGGIGATPRSWAKLGSFMDVIDKIPHEIQFQVMKGKIGSELAGQFLSFYNNYAKVIKMEDVEAQIKKSAKANKNPEKIGKAVAKLMKDQEAIQKSELANQFLAKYGKADTADEARPFLAYLYSLDVELLASFFKTYRSEDNENYMKLAKFDDELNGKALYKRIVSNVQNK